MTNNKVASYAERIERLLDERATIDADIKDIYTEVKSADLKPKVLRKAIANKRRKVDKQFEADVEEYAALLLALPGATYRGVSEKTGIPKSTLQRRVPRKANGTEPPHDPETGEITNADQGSGATGEDCQADRGGSSEPDAAEHGVLAGRPSGIEEGGRGSSETEVEGGVANSVRDGGAPVETSTVGPAVTTSSCSPATAAPAACSAVVPTGNEGSAGEQDPLTIPSFLDRRVTA